MASPHPTSDIRHPTSPASAFTLVELIVVIIILTLLAAVALPRFVGNNSRQAESECRNIQRLVSFAAERQSLFTEPIALEYNPDAATLSILTRRAEPLARGHETDTPKYTWARDRLLIPEPFIHTTLAAAWADGRPLPRKGWRVVFSPSEPRQMLVLQVESKTMKSEGGRDPGSKPAWQIAIGTEDSTATRTTVRAGNAVPMTVTRSIDLDAAGRGEKAW